MGSVVVEHVAASACDVWLVGSRRGARGRTSGQCGTEGAVVLEAVAAQPVLAQVGLMGAVLALARLGVISDAATISTLTTAR